MKNVKRFITIQKDGEALHTSTSDDNDDDDGLDCELAIQTLNE